MADEANTTDAEPIWEATLRRGKRYVAFGEHFLKDEPKRITEEQKNYLEQSAVDVRSIEGELDDDGNPLKEERAKFSFRLVDPAEAEDDIVAPPPRRRAAPTA